MSSVHQTNKPQADPFRSAEVTFITWIGMLANILLSVIKFAAGIIGHSQAVVADAVHSLSDLSTDIAVLVGVRFWTAPADESHPHGHRRIETLVTALIGAILALIGLGLGYRALATLRHPAGSPPTWIAFIAAVVCIASKEVLYRRTAAVGKRVRSSAVIANAWHHRSDALSSVPAALAVLGTQLFPEWSFLDHMGAVVVSLFILKAAWKITRPALGELVDEAAPERVRENIERVALATPGVKHVHALRTRYVGSALQVDLHVNVDRQITVHEGHEIAEQVQRHLLAEEPDVVDVVVHIEPYAPETRPAWADDTHR